MNMRWRKVVADFKVYRTQIVVIGLVLIIGAAFVATALNARAVLSREIAASFNAANASDFTLTVANVDDKLMAAAAAADGVKAVDARRVISTRVQCRDGTWLPMRLTLIRDFSAQRLDVVHLHDSLFPTSDNTILIEQSGKELLGAEVGASIQIRTLAGGAVLINIGAFVHDPGIAPSTQERIIYAYATPAMAAAIGHSSTLNQLQVKLVQRGTKSSVKAFGIALKNNLASIGTDVARLEVNTGMHPHDGLMKAMLNVLGVLAIVAFACSAALASYMVAAWMRREVRVVGIMKTLGASTSQIAVQYLALIAPAVFIAAGLALPLGWFVGQALIRYYAVSLNIDIVDWRVPNGLLVKELACAIVIPLLAMALPIFRATRLTAHAAIQDVGMASTPHINRFIASVLTLRNAMRATFALRNTWRRPWRLLTMVVGLAAGGALLLFTHSSYESLIAVIDRSLAQQGHDIEISMQKPVSAGALENVLRPMPNVLIAEAWRRASVTTLAATDERITLTAYPATSQLFKLPITIGRAPNPMARNEVIVTRALLDAQPTLQIGLTPTLQFRERRTNVTIVGVVEEIASVTMYTNFSNFDAITGLGDASSLIRIKANEEPLASTMSAIDSALIKAGMTPSQLFSREMLRDSLDEHMKVVLDVVRMAALGMALIGAIMLAATTLLNILERTRETGILRTIGATPRTIAAIYLGEAASITVVSFVLGIALSIPLTLMVLRAAERSLLHVAVPLIFSRTGFVILLSGSVIVITTVAITVARQLRRSVSQSLAYE